MCHAPCPFFALFWSQLVGDGAVWYSSSFSFLLPLADSVVGLLSDMAGCDMAQSHLNSGPAMRYVFYTVANNDDDDNDVRAFDASWLESFFSLFVHFFVARVALLKGERS